MGECTEPKCLKRVTPQTRKSSARCPVALAWIPLPVAQPWLPIDATCYSATALSSCQIFLFAMRSSLTVFYEQIFRSGLAVWTLGCLRGGNADLVRVWPRAGPKQRRAAHGFCGSDHLHFAVEFHSFCRRGRQLHAGLTRGCCDDTSVVPVADRQSWRRIRR